MLLCPISPSIYNIVYNNHASATRRDFRCFRPGRVRIAAAALHCARSRGASPHLIKCVDIIACKHEQRCACVCVTRKKPTVITSSSSFFFFSPIFFFFSFFLPPPLVKSPVRMYVCLFSGFLLLSSRPRPLSLFISLALLLLFFSPSTHSLTRCASASHSESRWPYAGVSFFFHLSIYLSILLSFSLLFQRTD